MKGPHGGEEERLFYQFLEEEEVGVVGCGVEAAGADGVINFVSNIVERLQENKKAVSSPPRPPSYKSITRPKTCNSLFM